MPVLVKTDQDRAQFLVVTYAAIMETVVSSILVKQDYPECMRYVS